jgi:hypothetical protein
MLGSLDGMFAYLRTPDTAKAQLGTPFTNLLNAVTDWIERELGPIEAQPQTWTTDGDGSRILVLPGENIQMGSVTSVMVNGAVVVPRDMVNEGWVQDSEAPAILMLAGPIGSYGWCDTVFWRGYQNVVVEYTSGYETVPNDLMQCACELAAFLHVEGPRLGIMSKSVGNEPLSFQTTSLPFSIRMVLKHYYPFRF